MTLLPYRAKLSKDTTPQELYNEIKAAAHAGSFPSIDGPQCLYRNGDKACLIGIFIPDEKFREALKYSNADEVVTTVCGSDIPPYFWDRQNYHEEGQFPEYSMPFVRHIQAVHDKHAKAENLKCKPWNTTSFLDDLRRVFSKFGHEVEA